MNTYLTKSKVDLIKEAKQDFFDIYKIDVAPFTRKIYFYFFVYAGKKYVHKRSLNFIYSNADTYTTEVDPNFCSLTRQISPPNVIKFLSDYRGTLLPNFVEENDKFLVYEYFEGDPVEGITAEEFEYLRLQHQQLDLTPFYNSMTYNLCRNGNTIKLVDLKHFELKRDLPFFLYFYNQQNCVNKLYLERSNQNIDSVIFHLKTDYPVENCSIIYY